MTTTTKTNEIIGGETRYGNQVYRVYFESGDWAEYGVNADNPKRIWYVGVRNTIYGGRAVCENYNRAELPEATDRPSAHAAMLKWLETH